MVLREDPLYAEAILFFDEESVVKEMLYVEFQAVLDGVVGIPEFAKKSYQAAYVTIWHNLSMHTVVLFKLSFDKQGHVDAKWNLPLRSLGSQATNGPDLGSGMILVMTRDLCEDADYKKSLWEPGKRKVEVLTSIRDSIKRNKLGLYVEGGSSRFSDYTLYTHAAEQALGGAQTKVDSEYQQQLVNNIESTLKYKYEAEMRTLETQHAQIIRQLESQNAASKEQANGYQQVVADVEASNKKHIEIIVNKVKKKYESELSKIKGGFEEALNVREMELHYSKESETQLCEELQTLQNSLPHIKAEAMNEYIVNLLESGVQFIVTQSGIGSSSLKLQQLDGYLQSPTGYWAKQCNVSEDHYLDWSHHYNNPGCQAGRTTGCACDAKLTKVMHPTDFVSGYSDMCRAHQLCKAKDSY